MEAIIQAIAWPLAVVIIVLGLAFGFRSKIGSLFDRKWSLKLPGGISANFAAGQQIEAEAQGKLTAPSEIKSLVVMDATPDAHPIYSIVDQSLRQNLEERCPNNLAAQLELAIRTHSIVNVERHHETNFRFIFGSQIRALLTLNQRANAQISLGRPFYDQGMAALDADKRPSYDQWVEFLFQTGYIQSISPMGSTDPVVSITPLGRDFLSWIIGRGVNTESKIL